MADKESTVPLEVIQAYAVANRAAGPDHMPEGYISDLVDIIRNALKLPPDDKSSDPTFPEDPLFMAAAGPDAKPPTSGWQAQEQRIAELEDKLSVARLAIALVQEECAKVLQDEINNREPNGAVSDALIKIQRAIRALHPSADAQAVAWRAPLMPGSSVYKFSGYHIDGYEPLYAARTAEPK